MTRRTVWSVVFVLGAATLGLRWFLTVFEAVPVSRPTGIQGPALRDPYLALTRFLDRMGRSVERTSDPERLLALDGAGVLVLDRHRMYHVSAARAGAVRTWVEAGGYLILVPESDDVPDVLVDELDLDWATTGLDDAAEGADTNVDSNGADAADEADAADAQDATDPARPPLPETTRVRIPGTGRPLTIDSTAGLEIGDVLPEWSAGDRRGGQQVVHVAVGSGAVTVVAAFDTMMSNVRLGQRDHAEFIWRLIERYGPAGPIVLLTRLDAPSLWDWLFTSARAALAAGLLALGLWTWHVAPRFGGVTAQAPSDRRQLHEHLSAVGRFVWHRHGAEVWLGVVRRAVTEKISRRLALPVSDPECVPAIAAQLALPPSIVASALDDRGADAASFVATTQALQSIDRQL